MATKKATKPSKSAPHKKPAASASVAATGKNAKPIKKNDKEKSPNPKKKAAVKAEKEKKISASKKTPVQKAKTPVISASSTKKDKNKKAAIPAIPTIKKEKKVEVKAELKLEPKLETKTAKKAVKKEKSSSSKLKNEEVLPAPVATVDVVVEAVPQKTTKKGPKNAKAESKSSVAAADLDDDLLDSEDDLQEDADLDDIGDSPEDYFENLEKQQAKPEEEEDDEDFAKSFAKTAADGEPSLSDLKRREMEALERSSETAYAEDIARVNMDYNMDEIRNSMQGIDFYAIADTDECLERSCENIQTTQGYCRYHYIKNWKAIKRKAGILKEGKLQELIEELVSHYPLKYIEAIMKDLSGDKEFFQVLKDLNIESTFSDDDLADIDLDDDITVETRGYGGVRVKYEEEEI